MADKKTPIALAITLASGVAAGRLSAPVLDSSAEPYAMRWLNDGPGKPTRYSISVGIRAGKGAGSRDIICSADGVPRLSGMSEGQVFDNVNARAVCDAAVKAGGVISVKVAKMAGELVK